MRNTSLPAKYGLLPLFEAVINSIHSIEEVTNNMSEGQIDVEVIRSGQGILNLQDNQDIVDRITGFKITDNGIGFNDTNMKSFETLDTDQKVDKGCRGVGRLLWLKAFKRVKIVSIYDADGSFKKREFVFDAKLGVHSVNEDNIDTAARKTIVELQGFEDSYKSVAFKKLPSISKSLLEHCLWHFMRDGGCPAIQVIDGNDTIALDEVYNQYMHDAAQTEEIAIQGQNFSITHIKFRDLPAKPHALSFCAANRLVMQESLDNKISGLYGKISDEKGDFIYSCHVSSSYLDEHVRPERTGFNIEENVEGLFEGKEISLQNIREATYQRIKEHLKDSLQINIAAGRERVEKFVAEKAPRYRPILARIPEDELAIDPNIPDKDLDIYLHKKLAELERDILKNGHKISTPLQGESAPDYYNRVRAYLQDVSDMKKSDLANYLCHRRAILDLLERSLKQRNDGAYATEDIIHQLIMPLRKDSNEVFPDDCNLWLLDEKLAFHDYLASDKTINAMPVIGSADNKRPDLLALNVYDNPILVSENQTPPLASIVIVEIKRPMRNDAQAGEDKDPIEQALGYLDRVRRGQVKTANGRPIPQSSEIPGYCYIVCDLTDSIKKRCKYLDLTVTNDYMGYFGFHKEFKAYIEVVSFDRLVDNAKKRNKAFFDKLGLPIT